MDVLFISGEAPTVRRRRPHGLISALARRGHSVTLVMADEGGTAFDDLADRCRVVPVRRRWLAAATARELAATSYDAVHVDRSAAMILPQAPLANAVVDMGAAATLRLERAMRSLGPITRAAGGAHLPLLRREELSLLARYRHLTVAAEDDAAALRTLGGPGHGGVYVVPCLIDMEHFAPPLGLRDPETLLIDLRGMTLAEALAALRATEATMRVIWAERATTRLTVLGFQPPSLVFPLSSDPRVVFGGASADPRGHLAAATLAFAPVECQALIPGPLEALATATPLIARSTLARDLGALGGEDLLIADAPADQAWAALALLDDAPYRGRLGRAGRKLVGRRNGWERVIIALEHVYEAAAGSAIAAWCLEVGLTRSRGAE